MFTLTYKDKQGKFRKKTTENFIELSTTAIHLKKNGISMDDILVEETVTNDITNEVVGTLYMYERNYYPEDFAGLVV